MFSATETHICQHCGTPTWPKTFTRGSIVIELVLWLAMILPGLLYSLWRLTTKQKGCSHCRQIGSLVPINSPVGQRLLKENGWAQAR
jgi:hypothetical protein